MREIWKKVKRGMLAREEGVDGILVTVGLCIIAILLCVVMKDGMISFIDTIMSALTEQAKGILKGTV